MLLSLPCTLLSLFSLFSAARSLFSRSARSDLSRSRSALSVRSRSLRSSFSETTLAPVPIRPTVATWGLDGPLCWLPNSLAWAARLLLDELDLSIPWRLIPPSIDLRADKGAVLDDPAGWEGCCSFRVDEDAGVVSTDGTEFFLGVDGIGGGTCGAWFCC